MTVTFALTGVGSACVDGVMVRSLAAPSVKRLPTVIESEPGPAFPNSARRSIVLSAARSDRLRHAWSAPPSQLRADAERIWWAGVREVLPERLIPAMRAGRRRRCCSSATTRSISRSVRRIAIVGAGKASGAMAVALENALGATTACREARHRLGQRAGRLHPADAMRPSCTRPVRPASTNRGRKASMGTRANSRNRVVARPRRPLLLSALRRRLRIAARARRQASRSTTRFACTQILSAAGANIAQLNTVRSQLSLVKGGGLARACRAGRLDLADHLRRARRSARRDCLRADGRQHTPRRPTRSTCSQQLGSDRPSGLGGGRSDILRQHAADTAHRSTPRART